MTLDEFAELYDGEEMLKADGYDDFCVGVVERFGMQPILCYSMDKILKKLMEDGMTEEEAVEFFEFNIIGAWAGNGTPCFLRVFS